MFIEHTDPKQVTDCKRASQPRSGQTATGYGANIPTAYMIRYGPANRWHRVYAMVYGNSGSVYLRHRNRDLFLDIDTEHRLQSLPYTTSTNESR